jgi:mannose-6-phosphate isomerase
MTIKNTPWGEWQILFEADHCKVKKITVNPHKRLSYQLHKKRSEIWVITQGSGELTLDNNLTKVEQGEVIQIKPLSAHRIANTGSTSLIIIETQLGTYFGEDDIVRLEDDYGRVNQI